MGKEVFYMRRGRASYTNFGYIRSFRLAARPLELAVSQATPPAAGRQLSHTPFTLSDFLTQNGIIPKSGPAVR